MTSLYYDLVPKDTIENLRWRIRCRERALSDFKFRDALWQACMSDVCFFMAFACIGKGTRVVTNRGPVPIEEVTEDDLVWDGAEWVSQGGAIYKGRRASIFAYEINVTPDHEIWTKYGWKPASERHDREGVRIPDGYSEKWKLSKHNEGCVVVPMQVRQRDNCSWRQPSWRKEYELRMQVRRSKGYSRKNGQQNIQYLERYDSAMHEQAEQGLGLLRRSRHQGVRKMDEVRKLLRGHGRATGKTFYRSLSKQRWKLRARQLSMGNMLRAIAQSTTTKNEEARNFGRSDDDLRDYGSNWTNAPSSVVSHKNGLPSRPDTPASTQDTEVYDLLNCGSRQCFTVLDANDKPLIVHNCWGYDPRSKHKVIPFIPYPHQEKVFQRLDDAFEYTEEGKTLDVLVDKARAQGGTFGYLWVDLRRWLRDTMFSAGYVTRNADLVDSKTDSDTVLWKMKFALDMLPFWMRPVYERNLSQHTFENLENGSLLKGYSAGQDVAAGGRATVFTMDEAGAKDFVSGGKDYSVMESLHDVTNYLRLVSARYVDSGVFHEACEAGGTEGGWHLVLDWKDHPVHSKHSYVVLDNVPKAVKPEDAEAVAEYHKSKPNLRELLEKKGFKYEGVIRSPWYDMRCLRKTARPQLIASQLDRNPKGAVGKVFPHDLLERMKKANCKQPVWVGNPVFDSETLELKGLIPREDGALKLWFRPGIDDSPPLGPYTLTCDIASGGVGVFASNSVASGIDDRTGEQAIEYVVKGLEPRPFARIVVGLCLWLRKAKLGWEDSGVSGGFAKEVMEVLYYGNIYFRNVTQLGTQKKSRKPGFPCYDVDKADMFEQFSLALEKGLYIPRSSEMLVELGEYEWDNGKIVHAPSKSKGVKDKNHGDRAIAAAGSWLVYSADNVGEKVDSDEETGQNPEYGSFLWRERQERRSVNSGSPTYGLRDILRG